MDKSFIKQRINEKVYTLEKANHKLKSKIWEHYLLIRDENNEKVNFIICSKCQAIFSYNKHVTGTSSLLKHMKICENEDKKEEHLETDMNSIALMTETSPNKNSPIRPNNMDVPGAPTRQPLLTKQKRKNKKRPRNSMINAASRVQKLPKKIKSAPFPERSNRIIPPSEINNRIPPLDEFEVFGECVATHLRQLSSCVALKCQSHIQNYLINRRLEECAKMENSCSAVATELDEEVNQQSQEDIKHSPLWCPEYSVLEISVSENSATENSVRVLDKEEYSKDIKLLPNKNHIKVYAEKPKKIDNI